MLEWMGAKKRRKTWQIDLYSFTFSLSLLFGKLEENSTPPVHSIDIIQVSAQVHWFALVNVAFLRHILYFFFLSSFASLSIYVFIPSLILFPLSLSFLFSFLYAYTVLV